MAAVAMPAGAEDIVPAELDERSRTGVNAVVALERIQVAATRKPQSGFDVAGGVTVVDGEAIGAGATATVACSARPSRGQARLGAQLCR